MDEDRLARTCAAVASGTVTGNDLVRAVAVAGLTHAELIEVQRRLEAAARYAMVCASILRPGDVDDRCGGTTVSLYGWTSGPMV
jgi:hypothetical protein